MNLSLSLLIRRTLIVVVVATALVFASTSVAVAAISFGSVATGQNATSSTLTISVPASTASGDTLIASVVYEKGSDTSVSVPSGWTLIRQTDNSNKVGLRTYYRVADGSETATYTWTITKTSDSTSKRGAGAIVRYTGVDTSSPVDISADATDKSTSATAPSVTTASDNELILVVFALKDNGSNAFSTPSGTTERFDIANTGADPAAGGDDFIQASAGATATTTATVSNKEWAAQTIALKAAPTLTVIKHVVIDNGGTATAGEWNLAVSSSNGGSGTGSAAGAESPGTSYTLQAGKAYSVAESGGPSGYSESDSVDCNIASAVAGASYTCTITNDDQPGTLIVNKVLVNNNGGTAATTTFTYKIDGGGSVAFEADGSNNNTVNAGSHSVVEDAAAGYTTTYANSLNGSANCNSLAVPNGGTVTCTITNDDIPPYLALIKYVVGGDAESTDWELFADGDETSISGFGFAESEGDFWADTYTLSEGGPSGYAPIGWSCTGDGEQVGSTITLDVGESAECSITNTFVPPGSIVIVKETVGGDGTFDFESDLTEEDGGDFSITTLGGSGSETFSGLEPGPYSVSETDTPEDWEFTDVTCESSLGDDESPEAIELDEDEVVTCTFTNTYTKGTLIVEKVLPDDNGGTLGPADFSFQVNGGDPIPFEEDGVNELIVPVGDYTVTEPEVSGYDTSYDNCSEVYVGPGETVTCTITNDDIPPYLTLIKEVSGGDADAEDWTLTATGASDSPTNLSGATPVASDSGFKADTYTLGESGPTGYTPSGWSCSGDVENSGDQITLSVGQSATCTITNTFSPPPVISEQTSASPTETSLTVTWTTDHPATSRVIYDTVSHPDLGEAPNYGYANSTAEDPTLVTSHSVIVSSLAAGTTYFLRTVSHGSPETVSDEFNGTTSASAPSPTPTTSGNGAPSFIGVVNGAGQVLGASTGPGEVLGETTFQFTVNLRYGSRGNDVIELQKVLIAAGYLHIAAPTGWFGPLTLAAVKQWQAAHGIPATGFVGPLTRAALNAL